MGHEKSLQPEVMGIAAESKSSTCFSPRARKQTTQRCYHSSSANFLIRHHLLLPNLSFFSKSIISCFGQSSTWSVIRHLFLPNRNFHSWLLWEVQQPWIPSPGLGEALWLDGCRAQHWEVLEMMSGRDPPALHHTHPSTSLTPPEAQHSGTQPGAFTQTNSAEGGDSTSDKLPGKSILTTV